MIEISFVDIDVKPCPICGADPEIIVFSNSDYPYVIRCPNVDYHGSGFYNAEKRLTTALKKWNKYYYENERERGNSK